MKKKILITVGALGIILIAAAYFTLSTLINKGVKTGVETFCPKITKTEVHLEGANISPLNGTGVLKGLFIGNPEGFKSEKAFSANKIEVNLDVASLLSDKIVIEKIYVGEPHVVYEKKLLTDNLKQLLKNIEESSLMEEDEEESESEIRLEIRELSIVNGKITVGILGKGITIPLPDIHLSGLGSHSEEGLTPNQMAGEIMKAVLRNTLQAVAKAGGAVVEGGAETAGEVGEKAKGALGGLKGFLKKKKKDSGN